MTRAVPLAVLIVLGGCTRAGPPPGLPAPPVDSEAPQQAEAREPPPETARAEVARRPVRRPPPPPAAEPWDVAGADAATPVEATPPEPVDALTGSPAAGHSGLDDALESWFEYWLGPAGAYTQASLERMGRYQHIVDRAIAERGLPRSLRYLPIVESHYNPNAVSWVGAVGMWQFMPGTAREVGLTVTSIVDQRRDPLVATEAALDMLSALHERFDSWFLALAAYNGGPNRMARILRQHFEGRAPSASLFLEVRRHLPRETRDFIPKFLAAAAIGGDPAAYGFTDVQLAQPMAFDEVSVPYATSLDVIAEAAETTQDEIEALNPQLVRGMTPAGVVSSLRVPAGGATRFAANYARVPPEERLTFAEHTVSRGETLGHIAQMYGIRTAELEAANPRVRPRYLQIGQRLVVPRAPSARRAVAAASGSASPGSETGSSTARRGAPTPSSEGVTTSVTHTVQRGESLWEIARSYGVTVGELTGWNRVDSDGAIHPGDRIEVRDVRRLVYRVRSGDTLSGIAARYGVGMRELARANGIALDAVIRPGDEVRIPPRASGSRR